MSGFNTTSIEVIQIPDLDPELPLIIDDCSLALQLGFRPSRLWYVLHTRDTEHYTQHRIKKKSGKYRMLHAPSKILKLMQRNLLNRVIDPLQGGLGDHVAAYRPTRSVVDAVKRHIPACPLCDNRTDPSITLPKHDCPRAGTYINLDLKDFFPSTTVTHIRNYLKSVGYSHEVSGLMANLMIVRSKPNPNYIEGSDDVRRFSEVPQGAPTSGAICNLVADKLIDQPILQYLRDKDLTMGLTEVNRKWVYTRYADDLALTCGVPLPLKEIKQVVADVKRIVASSGYRVNNKKTRYMYGTYYQKRLLGMVFTERPNYAQVEYRRLRAITHNCLSHGFESQYLKAGKESAAQLKSWLYGTILWIKQINASKAEVLLKEYKQALCVWEGWEDLEGSNA